MKRAWNWASRPTARACPHGALHCGPIDELMALAENAARPIECGTGPNYLYS